jgi:hypothetical protein
VIDFLRRDGEILVVPDAIVDDIREIENREPPSAGRWCEQKEKEAVAQRPETQGCPRQWR